MKTNHPRQHHTLAILAAMAAIATISLTLPSVAAAAPGAGDWGTANSGIRVPGTSGEGQMVNECKSDGGCDYSPDLTFTDHATNGGSFTPGDSNLIISGVGTVGTCTATTSTVTCVITESGHVAKNAKIQTEDIGWQVSADAPSNARLFEPGTHVSADWTGNDPDNDVYPIYTPGSGDWGTANSGVRAPGTSGSGAMVNRCLSEGGCDYSPDLTFTDHATNGGSFTPGDSNLTISGVGTVGSCTATTSAVTCVITERGHVAKGAAIQTEAIGWQVDAGAAPDVLVFEPGTHVSAQWTGNDPSNDVYPIRTPPEAGAPMADWAIAGGIGGAALLAYGGLALRRRHRTQPAAG